MDKGDIKKYHALHYALARSRGILLDVLDGEIDKDRVKRLYEATAWEEILKSIDIEDDLDEESDWNKYLTESEKRKIAGID